MNVHSSFSAVLSTSNPNLHQNPDCRNSQVYCDSPLHIYIYIYWTQGRSAVAYHLLLSSSSWERRMDNQKKVCVTGASGFLASWLIKRLLLSGYHVVGTVRDPGATATHCPLLPVSSAFALFLACLLINREKKMKWNDEQETTRKWHICGGWRGQGRDWGWWKLIWWRKVVLTRP